MYQGKNKAITFSYDDGVTQDRRLIEILNRYGLKATFNINSGLLDRPDDFLMIDGKKIGHAKVSAAEVRRLYQGHEVAVHTLTHPNLTELDEQEIVRQVEEDRKNLSALAGYEVTGMAYPCGGVNNDDRVAQVLKEHTAVRYARTITSSNSFAPQENLLRFNPSVYHLDWADMEKMADEFWLCRRKPLSCSTSGATAMNLTSTTPGTVLRPSAKKSAATATSSMEPTARCWGKLSC